ncbi:hypothetical protein J6590_024029 [Homalodisca vitripennis]|nr:hypothetical protein J6590_024029 [Homalodisca vitripennis]
MCGSRFDVLRTISLCSDVSAHRSDHQVTSPSVSREALRIELHPGRNIRRRELERLSGGPGVLTSGPAPSRSVVTVAPLPRTGVVISKSAGGTVWRPVWYRKAGVPGAMGVSCPRGACGRVPLPPLRSPTPAPSGYPGNDRDSRHLAAASARALSLSLSRSLLAGLLDSVTCLFSRSQHWRAYTHTLAERLIRRVSTISVISTPH